MIPDAGNKNISVELVEGSEVGVLEDSSGVDLGETFGEGPRSILEGSSEELLIGCLSGRSEKWKILYIDFLCGRNQVRSLSLILGIIFQINAFAGTLGLSDMS